MERNKIFLIVFVCVAVVCQVDEISAKNTRIRRQSGTGKEPCDTCPQQGVCVHKIRCPGHIRPDASNPECHLENGSIGVCCYAIYSAGSGRSSKTHLDNNAVLSARNASEAKWNRWASKAQRLMELSDTVVRKNSPDFGHYLATPGLDPNAPELGTGALLNMFVVQDLMERQAIDDDVLDQFIVEPYNAPYCPPQPGGCPFPASPFRRVNGSCTNPNHPTWAAANTGYTRLLPPHYNDGIWDIRLSVNGNPLPSARTVSAALILDGDYPSCKNNMVMMQWGQLVAHDTTSAVSFTYSNGSAISCCTREGRNLPPNELHWACAPIPVAVDDPFFSRFGRTCLNFVRIQIAPSPDCSCGYTKQLNGATHIPDLSQLYGNDFEKQNDLRAPDGYLKTYDNFGRDLPPLTNRSECINPTTACFATGDNKGNQIITLTFLHLALTRQHNLIVEALTRLNPGSDSNLIYFKAKAIMQAIYQHIVFTEWLPLFIGQDLIRSYNLQPSDGYATGYDPNVNPSTLTEFAVAALRMGHSTLQGNIKISQPETGSIHELVSISEVMNQPDRLLIGFFYNRLIHGMTTQPMQSVDPYVTHGLTRYMFRRGNAHGVDLASLNIQRGRDLGIHSYNQYRRLCGLQPFHQFSDFPHSAGKRLSAVYESPEDVDLWVGCLMEKPVKDGVVGPTCGHIIAEQFSRYMRGDRYFYKYGPDVNPGAFTPTELDEVEKFSAAGLLCSTRDPGELNSVPPRAFELPTQPGNKPVDCNSIPTMDLSKFKLL